MPPSVALVLFTGFVLWLFARERARRAVVSPAAWIAVIWITILGSRPASLWFGIGKQGVSSGDFMEGSPVDRLIFLLLIVAGMLVLAKRRVKWRHIINSNKLLFAFFLYCGISVLWSDYSFVSFKRWFKDLGNVVIVLVVLSEEKPIEALKSVLLRCAFLLIPYSMLLYKYYPELGRFYYGVHAQSVSFTGVTLGKNELGATLLNCILVLMWSWLYRPGKLKVPFAKSEVLDYGILLVMACWLMAGADSSTSLGCTLVGGAVVFGAKSPAILKRMKYLWFYLLGAVVVVMVLKGPVAGLFGRDATLTGRTDIWEKVLDQNTNPILGAGYYSFWLGDRTEQVSRDYYYRLNEAHNGYLETYLDLGLIGVALLIGTLLAAGGKIKEEVMRGDRQAILRLAVLVAGVIYNLTESSFNRLSIEWFGVLLAIVFYPRPEKMESQNTQPVMPPIRAPFIINSTL